MRSTISVVCTLPKLALVLILLRLTKNVKMHEKHDCIKNFTSIFKAFAYFYLISLGKIIIKFILILQSNKFCKAEISRSDSCLNFSRIFFFIWCVNSSFDLFENVFLKSAERAKLDIFQDIPNRNDIKKLKNKHKT